MTNQGTVLTVLSGLAAVGAGLHGVIQWSSTATLFLFGAGATTAFVAEAVVISRGWLEHHVTPAILGVPLYILCGWVVTLYLVITIALFMTSGWAAVALAASLATGYDMLIDHQGVRLGLWSYTGGPPGPSLGPVPWWNFAGWFFITASVASPTIMIEYLI